MPNQTHAGGIAYDNLKQMLWVSDYVDGQAAVSLYTMEALENYQYDKTKKPLPFLETHILEGLARNSFMAFREEIFMQDIFRFPGTVLLTGIR